MIFTVKCPYCKGKQNIEIDLKDYSGRKIYYDCEHCLECFEVVIKAGTQTLMRDV